MKVTNVGSACFLIEIGGIRLLTVPWITGVGFINGWAPLIELESYEIFRGVDYIWFSHEHADHFHPPSLRKLSQLWDRFPKVLFQRTFNGRVKNYLRDKYEAEVLEIARGKTFRLAEGHEIRITDEGIYDSYLQIKYRDYCFTHLSDCSLNLHSDVKAINLFAKDCLHVLTSQYGLVNAPCGSANVTEITGHVALKLKRFVFQVTEISPDYVIPSSSAIHFCQPDNLWMNQYRLSPQRAIDVLRKLKISSRSLLPVPYKTYDFLDQASLVNTETEESLFQRRLEETKSEIITTQKEVLLQFFDINKAVHERSLNLRRVNNKILVKLLRTYIGMLCPITFYVTDLAEYLHIDPFKGITERLASPVEDCVVISSYVLGQLYTSPYGVDALNASARYDLKGDLTLSKLNNHLNLVTLNTAGIYLSFRCLMNPLVLKKIFRIFVQWYKYTKLDISLHEAHHTV